MLKLGIKNLYYKQKAVLLLQNLLIANRYLEELFVNHSNKTNSSTKMNRFYIKSIFIH